MSPRHAAAATPHVARHARRFRRHPFARSTALVAAAVISFAGTGLVTAYARIEGNIRTADISHLTGTVPQVQDDTPEGEDPAAGRPLNILIMGSDVRDGENAEIAGQVEGMRSDTTILLHVSADRQRLEMVSIPRDSHVEIPSCERMDGSTTRPQDTRFNEAFSLGGQSGDVFDAAACTIRTVQALTGVPIDGWVVVDFAGFIDMVDAIGGIPMCIPTEMRSKDAGLALQPGMQTLDGPTALAYARARKGVGLGDGSDTGRITRQQELLAATAREVLSKNVLTDFPGLYRFLTAATRSLTADPETGNITSLAGLTYSLRSVPSSNIRFLTVPFAAYPEDPNQIVWTEEADALFAALAADRPVVPPAAPAPTDAPPTDEPTDPAEPAPTEPAPAEPTPLPTFESVTPDDVDTVCG